ncbi:MAG: hypothetical protein ABJH82_00310 [Polaribacter sp.]|uniref:hypothetical protein n=1 Tax=Polaribacter sp. TaxID=1920175 RepID=UPI0032648D91
MKIKMLPNWCKKVGLIIFFLSIVINFSYVDSRESFCKGYNDGYNSTRTESKSLFRKSSETKEIKTLNFKPFFIEKVLGSNSIHLFDVSILLGMIIYILAKEKIEDDYINKLRLESYQLTSVLVLFAALGLYSFFENLKFSLNIFITLYLLSYLIIFALKKRVY